jgi:oxaloacetate decarboxylase gamma subunit
LFVFHYWSDYSNSTFCTNRDHEVEHLNESFIEAGTLMLAGMVFVFTFLGLLVVFINVVLARLAIKYPDAVARVKQPKKLNSSKSSSGGLSPTVTAAITSAVHQYRTQHNKK